VVINNQTSDQIADVGKPADEWHVVFIKAIHCGLSST
jgi:hypothetical protein